MRNSWDADWGEEGYFNMDYVSARATLLPMYINYGAWVGDDFSITIDADIHTGSMELISSEDVAFGVYEWGGNNASITNNANVVVEHYAQGYAVVHGLFLWAGENAFLTNNGSVLSSVKVDGGIATAYGICFQGKDLLLASDSLVDVRASADGLHRATAYGVRYHGFNTLSESGSFVNRGSINAESTGDDSWAYGAYVMNAASVRNEGNIYVKAGNTAAGMLLYEVKDAVNTARIEAVASTDSACGVYAQHTSLVNEGHILGVDDEGTANTFGLYAIDSYIVNAGILEAASAYGESTAVYLIEGAIVNDYGAYISAIAIDGDSYGIDAEKSSIVNNGTIRAEFNALYDCNLSGEGVILGSLTVNNTVISPGNSLGMMYIDRDFLSEGGLTMNIEFANGAWDELVVGGSATIEGTDNVVNLFHEGYLASGDFLFIEAGSGGYGAIQTVNTAAMFEAAIQARTDGFALSIDRHSYSDFALQQEYKAMGIALDAARPLAEGEFAAMLNRFDSYLHAEAVQAGVSDLFPTMNSDASASALSLMQEGNVFAARHAKGLPAKALESDRRFGTWFSVMNADADIAASGAYAKLKADTKGYGAGAEYAITNNWTLGVSATNAKQKLSHIGSADKGSAKADQVFVSAMWDRRPGAEGPYAGVSLGLARLDMDSRRIVGEEANMLEGAHKGSGQSLWIGGGWDLNNSFWTTRPFVDFQYSRMKEDAYTERGNGGAALFFDERDSDSLLAGVGMSVSANFRFGSTVIIPELRIMRQNELLAEPPPLMGRFAQGPLFRVEQRDMSGSRTTMNATVRTIIDERVMATIDFERREYELKDSASDSLSARLHLRF